MSLCGHFIICMSHFTVYNNIFPSESVRDLLTAQTYPLSNALMNNKGS